MSGARRTVSTLRSLIVPFTVTVVVIALLASLSVGGRLDLRAEAVVPGDNGKIAFDTDRDSGGTASNEVYVVDADGSNPTNVTNHPAPDSNPAWSPDGSKIAFSSQRDGSLSDIFMMDADGSNPTNLTSHPSSELHPTWSPDGSQIAFTRSSEIYVMDADGSNPTNLTNNADQDLLPSWSPDGTMIAFQTGRDGDWEVYVMGADGSNPTNLTNHPGTDLNPDWSPDGSKIGFGSSRDGNAEIYVMDADGSNPTNVTNDPASDSNPAWSPDGSKIAFGSFRDGNPEIYVMDADGSNPTNLTNNAGSDSRPNWQPLADADSDGVLHPSDACPTLPGIAEENGCPPPGPPLAVGGVAGLLDADDSGASVDDGRGDNTGYIAALAGVVAATLIAGGWYARRRWM